MSIYFIVLFIVIALALTELVIDDKRIAIITGTVLALFAGLRFYLGYDFISYGDYYNEANQLGMIFDGSIRLESGYLFFSTLFSSLGFNYYAFVLFFSILTLAIFTYFLYKYLPYPSMVLAYYYGRFFMARDMGQVRGALAAIILLFAIPYILKKQPLKFLLIVFLASLFHVTAWAFIAAYIIHLVIDRVTWKNSLVLLIIATISGVFLQNPALYLWAIPSGYAAYFTNPYYTSGPWLLYPILWMQVLLLFGMILFLNDKKIDDFEWINLLMKIYLISPIVLLATGTLETVGGRISTLFATVEVLLIPYFFLSLTKYKLLNVIFYIGFSIIIFLLIFVLSGMYERYIPYQTVF